MICRAADSCYAYTIAPLVNSRPCQLIGEACSALGSLPRRIANYVSSIFTQIAEFISNCRRSLFNGSPLAHNTHILTSLMRSFVSNYPNERLGTLLGTASPAQAREFLSRMYVFYQVIDLRVGPYDPTFLASHVESSQTTFAREFLEWRANFAGLDENDFNTVEREILTAIWNNAPLNIAPGNMPRDIGKRGFVRLAQQLERNPLFAEAAEASIQEYRRGGREGWCGCF